jgi:hypothetical protein
MQIFMLLPHHWPIDVLDCYGDEVFSIRIFSWIWAGQPQGSHKMQTNKKNIEEQSSD